MFENIQHAAFEERSIDLPSGFSLIDPFINHPKSNCYELFLDNNALIRTEWLNELPVDPARSYVVTPFHAVAEQWLSNPKFRENPIDNIKILLAPFVDRGILFEANFERTLASSIKRNSEQLRTQWMMGYLYVILIYRIISDRDIDNIDEILFTLKYKDVPIFSSCMMFCILAMYLRKNQKIKLRGNKKSAFSYIRSFIDLHKGSKKEKEINIKYLRNRACDISMWLYVPALLATNYKNIGKPFVVTQDKAMKNILFKCIAFILSDVKKMAPVYDEFCFELNDIHLLYEILNKCVPSKRENVNRSRQLIKL